VPARFYIARQHLNLAIIACPLCKNPLEYDKDANELICKFDRLAFPIRDGIPVMLEEEAREI